MRLFLNIFRKLIIFLFIAGVVFSNLPSDFISTYISHYSDNLNVVDNMWKLQDDDNVVDNFSTLNQIAQNLKVKEAQAANAGQMVLYFHKEASDYNQLYNSLNWAPPEPAADTASGVTSTVNVNANPPTALCESTNINIANQGNYNKIGSSGAAAAVRCLASFISPPVGQAFSIATGDAVITPVMWIQDGATTGISITYLYFYKLCAAAGGDCAAAGSLVRFETATSTTDPGTTITAAAITASAPDIATTFAAGDRIAAIVARENSTTTAMYILVDNTARTGGNVSRVTIKYTAITPNKPSLAGAKDDDFTVGAATTACTTGGVAYNTKWTCLQGTAASTAGAFNNGNAAGTIGDSTDWLWLRNQTTATTAVTSNFGATPSNTFLYQTLNTGYGNGTVRTVVNSSTTYTIDATAPTAPWNHSGLVLWTSNTDYIEVQVHSTAQTNAASTGTVQVALNNCTVSCTGNNGTITNVSLNPTATTGVFHRVWIGFSKTGTSYQAQYSTNGTTWNSVGTAVTHATEFSRVGLNAFAIIANPISTYAGAFEWFQHTFATLTIGVTAGSKVTTLNSGDTSQYANTTGCASAAACAAFTLSIDAGSETITSIGVTVPTGQTATTNLSNLALFYDTDGNYSNGVTGQYGTTVASLAANGSATVVSGSLAISTGTIYYFYVRFDLINGANNPAGGETAQFQIANNADVGTSGSPTKTGAPQSLAGTTTILPNATSISYVIGGDGGRSGDTAILSGYGFGAPTAGVNREDCTTATVDRGCIKFTVGGTTNVLNTNITSWTNTSIVFTVAAGLASEGGASAIEVRAANQADSTKLNYYIYPTISSFTATFADGGYQDGTITITGDHLGSLGVTTNISFNGQNPESVGTWTATSISTVATPNTGTDSGTITVTRVSDSKASNTSSAFYIYPQITSIVDDFGGASDTAREYSASDNAADNSTIDLKDGEIQIDGNHFGAAGTITILGSTATQAVVGTRCSGSSYTATCITVWVPTAIADNSYTGNVALTRTSDTKTNTYAGFRILPRIVSNTPNNGVINDVIQLSGDHFCQSGACPISPNRSTASNNVKFGLTQDSDSDFVNQTGGAGACNGAGAAWTDSEICAKVPTGISGGSQPTIVKSDNYDSNTKAFTVSSLTPNDPTNLLQFKTSNNTSDVPPTHDPLINANPDGKIAVGGGINQSSAWLRATAQAGVNATLCIEVEVKQVATAFDGTGTVLATGTPGCQAFTIGTPVKLFMNSAILLNNTNYKWRARIKNNDMGQYSNWINANVDGQGNSFYIDTVGPSSLSPTCPTTTFTATTADINWTPIDYNNFTTQFTKQVQYGTDSSFAVSSCNPVGGGCGVPESILTSGLQTVKLTNLLPNTQYFYRVRSKDASGNETTEGYGLSGNTSCTFTTLKAATKTVEYLVVANQDSISSVQNSSFQIDLSESNMTGFDIKDVFMEINGIVKPAAGPTATLGVKVFGSNEPLSYDNYVIPVNSNYSTPFTVLYKFNAITTGLYTRPRDSAVLFNTISLNPPVSGISVASAKIIITYYHQPQQ